MTRSLAPWLTPPPTALRMADFALALIAPDRKEPIRILEPSAGEGHLVEAIFALEEAQAAIAKRPKRVLQVTAVELHRGRAAILRERFPQIEVVNRCFITWCEDTFFDGWTPQRSRPFDISIANPPYDDGQDTDHVDAMSRVVTRSCVLVRSAFRHGTTERATLFEETRIRRERIMKGRPSFIDRENGKEGTGRHEFQAIDLERPMDGWRRAEGEVDRVETAWW